MNIQEFGKARDWKRVIGPAILIFLLFVLPVTAFFIYASFDQHELKFAFWSSILIFLVWYIYLKHLHTAYSFPYIQIDPNFFVVCEYFSRRRVYNLEKVSSAKRFLKLIYFKHNNWSVVISLASLTEDEREKLYELLKSS